MTHGPHLTHEGEESWLRLKLHLEMSDHFALAFIFTAHSGVIRIFRERLADIYRARVTRLNTPVPANPSSLLNELLPKLLRPSVHEQSLNAPCWIDLSIQQGQEWTKARLNFLMRLNEQRESLRNALNRPLVLVLPLEERSQIKELIPDLWAIRDFGLVTESWLVSESEKTPVIEAEPSDMGVFPLSEYDQSQIDEWERLLEKNVEDRGFLLASDRAFQVCIRCGRFELASRIASSQKRVAEKRVHELGETPESLRDLSVSLDKVGTTAKAMGEWSKAETRYEESLTISRKIIEHVGETPESLRDLSVSLNNVGDTAKAMGEWSKAETRYEESLTISRKIIERVGETPESLRDLSVSLDKVGATAKAMGEWEKAQKSFEESLTIRRKIIERVGETPESLRDLSVSLDNVGATAQDMGESAKAEKCYLEGLAIAIPLSHLYPNHMAYSGLAEHFKNRLEEMESVRRTR
jgi:tetratricopeptide (TPR) repeat protein